MVLAINGDQNVFVYEICMGADKRTFEKLQLAKQQCYYLDEIIDVKFINKNKYAVMCSNSESVKLVDLKTGGCEIYAGHSDIVITLDRIQLDDPSKGYVLSGAKDMEIRLWSYDDSRPKFQKLRCIAVFKGHNQNICSVNFAPKRGRHFVSSSQDKTIKLWSLVGIVNQDEDSKKEPVVVNQAQLTVMAHQKFINMAKFSPNDKLIATASQDKTIKIWDAKNLQLLHQLTGHKKNVWDLQFSPKDKHLITVSGDETVKVWDLSSHKCLATLQGHQDQIVKVQWVNMGLQFITASVDGIVKLWNLKKQQCVNTYEMHKDRIWCMDLYEEPTKASSDDDDIEKYMSSVNLVTGGCDSTIKVWQDCTIEQENEDKEA